MRVSANQQRGSTAPGNGAESAFLVLDPSQAHHPRGMDVSPKLGGTAAQGAQKQMHGAVTSAEAQVYGQRFIVWPTYQESQDFSRP
eukprot:10057754-Karenia_brevis.AAC.1